MFSFNDNVINKNTKVIKIQNCIENTENSLLTKNVSNKKNYNINLHDNLHLNNINHHVRKIEQLHKYDSFNFNTTKNITHQHVRKIEQLHKYDSFNFNTTKNITNH